MENAQGEFDVRNAFSGCKCWAAGADHLPITNETPEDIVAARKLPPLRLGFLVFSGARFQDLQTSQVTFNRTASAVIVCPNARTYRFTGPIRRLESIKGRARTILHALTQRVMQ
jgi:hypothetical protein